MPRLTPLLLCFAANLALANKVDLSPQSWPEGELERYENLFGAEKPLAESKTGMVVSTTGAAAARVGLEALNLVEQADLGRLGHYTKSPEALLRLTRIARMVDIMGTSLTHQVTPVALIERQLQAMRVV